MYKVYRTSYIGHIESLEQLEKITGRFNRAETLSQMDGLMLDDMVETINNSAKPLLGAKPCYIQADERIKDLSEAISRYAGTGNYKTIRKWAKEILMQCDIAEMEKNEEMVDWIAIQFPKIFKVFQELDIME